MSKNLKAVDNVDTSFTNADQPASNPSICPSGPYVSPKADDLIDPSSPLDIEWDPTCFINSTSLQLDLYGGQGALLHAWTGINSTSGHLTVDLDPTWWNNTNSPSAHLDFIPLTEEGLGKTISLPSGPTFTLGGQTSLPASASQTQNDGNWISDRLNPLHLSKPHYIAAIVAPLATVAVLGAVIWAVVRSRAKTARERRQWEEGIRPITRY